MLQMDGPQSNNQMIRGNFGQEFVCAGDGQSVDEQLTVSQQGDCNEDQVS
jgi:hypothetical protein